MNGPTDHNAVRLGFSEVRNITKESAKIFYFSSLFLPREKQDAACAIYAFCRYSDEAVDNLAFKDKLERLSKIKEELDAVYSGSALSKNVLMALRYTVENLRIPRRYFDELLEGMHMDLEKKRYANFQELSSYCYKVAGVIGLIMLKVFACRDPQAEKYAIDLGVAMQLTNIIRDVKEDWEKGRVYLPQDEMESFGVEEKDIEHRVADYGFRRLIEFQAERAKHYYNESLSGLNFIDNRRLRFVISAMRQMYASILDAIEERGFDVFSGNFRVSAAKKVYIIFRGLIREYL